MEGGYDDIGTMALFARVAQLESITAAAREAGLVKSVVSKRLKDLERRLGVALLLRTTRRVTLTAEGARVYEHCAALLANTAAARRALAQTDAGERGRIRVNAPVAFAQRFLVPLIGLHLEAHDGIDIELDADDTMVDATDGRHDLVIRIAREIEQASLVAPLLARDRLVIVGAPAYFEVHGMPGSPRDLSTHRCLRYAPRSAGVEWRFKGEDGPLSVPVEGRFVAGDDVTLRDAAVAGLGLTVMPRCFVTAEIDAGRLVTLFDDALWAPDRGIHALLPEGRLAPTRVKRLLDLLRAQFRTTDWVHAIPGRGNTPAR